MDPPACCYYKSFLPAYIEATLGVSAQTLPSTVREPHQPLRQAPKTLQMEQYSRLSMDAQEHQELIYALSKPLKERYSSRLDKTPRNFDTELKNACAGQQRNIFLGTGFQAWFAYFMTDPQTQTAVQQLSGPAAQSVARHLCMIKPHPSIEALFQHIFYKSNRARARCCEYKSHARLTVIQLDS